jgi:hypothetical protein
VVLVVFAYTRHEYLAAGALVLVNAALLAQEGCCVASLQSGVRRQIRGRVAAWRGTVNWGLDLSVTVPLAWAAAFWGTGPALIYCAIGGACLAVPLGAIGLLQREPEAKT